jgi:hypothetical protein
MSKTDPWLPDDPSKLLVADPGRREPITFESDGNGSRGTSTARPRPLPESRRPPSS